jgi:hypothetical protein
MRIFLIAADIVMGLILGVFLYVVVSKTWVVLAHPIVAGVILAASVMIVMFRVPNGSLARRENRPGN